MTREGTQIPPDFVLKQIENEIGAGFAFVAAARQAFGISQTAEKPPDTTSEAPDSVTTQVRIVTNHLKELRAAVEGLAEIPFPGTGDGK